MDYNNTIKTARNKSFYFPSFIIDVEMFLMIIYYLLLLLSLFIIYYYIYITPITKLFETFDSVFSSS